MHHPPPLRLILIVLGLFSVVLAALLLNNRQTGQLRIILPQIDGDAALIITPDGHTVLIDGGADGASLATWLGNTLPFGQRRLDALVLTQSTSDPVSGQLAAIRRYRIGMALLGEQEQKSSSLEAWWELLLAQNTMPQVVAAGDRLQLGDCTLHTLGEHTGRLALHVDCPATTAYFLQAIDDEIEAALEGRALEQADLVVLNWHRPTNQLLLHALHPKNIVFTSGNGDGSPQRWNERQIGDAQLYHTALNGQIEVLSDGQQTWLRADQER